MNWEKEIKPNHHLLDIGCWAGERLKKLKDKCNVYGIDINTERFKEASEEIRKKMKYGDVTKNIPYQRKFNWIILTEVLEHIEKEDAALKNISNSLKEGGRLVLSTPKHIPFLNFWDPAWVRWKFGGNERHKHYKQEELFAQLKKHNLIVEHYKVEGGLGWLFTRWFNVFLRYVLRLNKQISSKIGPGYFDWVIIAKKVLPLRNNGEGLYTLKN